MCFYQNIRGRIKGDPTVDIIQKVKSKIKHSTILGKAYVCIMKAYFKYLKWNENINSHQIIFSSFSGRQFSDSPKAIYDWLINDLRFSKYNLIWAFENPNNFPEIDKDHKVAIDTPEFFKLLFASKYWVANTGIERLVPFEHTGHVYIQTWHGVPLKHLGTDENNLEYLPKNWYKNVKFDLLICSSKYDCKIFQHIFPSTSNIQSIGLPRNYDLTHHTYKRSEIINKLKLDSQKPILLYAPTFREYQPTKSGSTYIDTPFSQKNKKWLLDHYNVLMRGHYFTESIEDDSFVDVTKYEDLNELMRASDLLVTDYSSIMFDYSILGKPIFLYMYDFDKYLTNRGMYIDPRKLGLSYSLTEAEFIEQIKRINVSVEEKKAIKLNHYFNNKNTSISLIDYFRD